MFKRWPNCHLLEDTLLAHLVRIILSRFWGPHPTLSLGLVGVDSAQAFTSLTLVLGAALSPS